MKEHYRSICKSEKSGSGGSSKQTTNSNWTYYKEFSFMKQFFISRRYLYNITSDISA